jgi:Nucleotidyl transferase AbiEii toxin, Type IV TA system
MNGVITAAAEIQAFCESQAWRFCFIGGLALQRWGEPRETVDVDLTVITGFGDETSFIDPLLENFETRIAHAAQFARERRVLLLRSRHGVGLDIALALCHSRSAWSNVHRNSNFHRMLNCGRVLLKTWWC